MNHILDRYLKDLPREVAALTGVSFCVALGFGIVAPVVPLFAKSFGVSALAASAVISLFALMRFLSAAPAGWLVNRLGERWVLGVGLAIVAVSSALAGTAQTYSQLLILRAIGGTGSAMFTVSAMSLLLRTVDPQYRGRATSLYQGGFLFGGLAGPAVGGLVVAWNIRAPFFVYAGTLTLASLTAWLALPKGLGHPEKDESFDVSALPEKMLLAQALRIRAYWTSLTINIATGMTSFGLRTSLIPLFVIEVLHRDARTASLGFLAGSIAQALLLLPVGRMVDIRGRKPVLIFGTALLTITMAMMADCHSTVLFYLSVTLMGAASAFLGSAPASVVGDVVGSRRGGQVVGLYQMTGDLGVIIGPLLAGFLKDVTGGYFIPFTVGVGVSLFALLMSVTMRETKSPSKAETTEDDYDVQVS